MHSIIKRMQSVDYTRSKSYKKLAKLSVLCLQQFRLKVEPRGGERRQTKFTDQSKIPIPNQS